MKKIYLFLFKGLFLFQFSNVSGQNEIFNYKKIIEKTQVSTLFVSVQSVNKMTGEVVISGGDSQGPTTPFTFIWGDNTSTPAFFPATHKYADPSKNYVLKVIAQYSDHSKDSTEILVSFVKPVFDPITLDPVAKVVIPVQPISFSGRNNMTLPSTLSFFSDNSFTGKFSRTELEYILSAIGSIEYNYTHGNLYLYEKKFQQYLLRDANFGGGYSIWYSDPVALAAGDALVKGEIDFSSLAHEMGHNFTLNTPANYIFGGKIDGNANACYSESMAQIFQHSAGYDLINNYKKYGFGDDTYRTLVSNFSGTFKTLKSFYQRYLNEGKKFTSWNDPATPTDEALPSFATTAYKFCEYAELEGKGYTVPVQRMMQFLQNFNVEWHKRFDQFNNTGAANSFRATMMVAALSHAFQRDLRADFIALNYPVNNTDWAFLNPQILEVSEGTLLIAASEKSSAGFSVTSNVEWTAKSSQTWLTISPASGSGNQKIVAEAMANSSPTSRTAVITFSINGITAKTVNVTQSATAPVLTVSTKILNLNYLEGSTATFDVTSNVSWAAASSQPWMAVNPVNGNGNSKITVIAGVNQQSASRSATITLMATGVADQFIEITQDAALILGIELPGQLAVFPNPVKDILQFKNLPAESRIDIYNLHGQNLKSIHTDLQTNHLSVEQLPAGLYQLRISSEAGSSILKIIKL